ncbi:MAG: DUF4249 domain-containing protein [Bacteroidetes bacterium]|nr:DUF4249 domain-containing protein [Bacteroidota bacterium]
MKIYFMVLPIIIMLFGCEDVIEVQINDADPQIIIEANISDNYGPHYTYITMSTDFYKPNEYEGVSGAEVIIEDNNGFREMLTEISSGKYSTSNILGEAESQYKMTVNVNRQQYSALSTLPVALKLDSVTAEIDNRGFHNDEENPDQYKFDCYFQDRPGVKDYARFKVYKNGVRVGGNFLYQDRLSDGNYIDYFYFRFDEDDDFFAGDTVTIELITIDLNTFNYFNELNDAIASGNNGGIFGSAAPGNPTNNWDNGAFGYFGANSVDSYTLIIPE